MVFKNRLIMAVFALFLLGSIFIVLSKQSNMQSKQLDLLLPALSPISSRSDARLPKWMGETQSDGKVLYINFWASWCEPCKEELPYFETLKTEFEKEGFEILLVNLDYGDDAILAAKKMKAELAPNLNAVYENAKATRNKLNLKGLPYHSLIDRSGRVAASFYAPLAKYKSVFKRRVRALLTEKASP